MLLTAESASASASQVKARRQTPRGMYFTYCTKVMNSLGACLLAGMGVSKDAASMNFKGETNGLGARYGMVWYGMGVG